MTEQDEINRAEYARQVTTNPVFIEAINILRANMIEDFSRTGFKQSSERDEIWRKMQTVDYIENYLATLMETGKLAKLTLVERTKKAVGM